MKKPLANRKPPKSEADVVPVKRHLRRGTPGEEAAALGMVRTALLAELAPRTPLQRTVASNIAENESDLTMLRQRRNALLWQGAAQQMAVMLQQRLPPERRDEAWPLALAWASGDPAAAREIEAQGIDPELAHNHAALDNLVVTTTIDTQIERLERRRRLLLEDYRSLQALAPKLPVIADAELVEEDHDG